MTIVFVTSLHPVYSVYTVSAADADECAAPRRRAGARSQRPGRDGGGRRSSSVCRRHEHCVNTLGSYVCRPTATCVGGFTVDPATRRCVGNSAARWQWRPYVRNKAGIELKQNRAMPPPPILWSAGGIMFSTCPYRCACVRPGRRHYPTVLRSIFRVSSDVGKQSIVDHCKEKTQ